MIQLAKLTRMNALLGLLVVVITLHYGVTTFTSKLIALHHMLCLRHVNLTDQLLAGPTYLRE